MTIGVLFDLDGTLLDTLQDLTDSVNYTLRHYGCPERTPEQIRSFLGSGAEYLIRMSLPGKETDPSVAEALAYYQGYYKDHSQIKTAPYAGIPEALAELGGKYPIAVVSNKPDAPAKLLCSQYFPGVYALGESADCPRKPAPDMVFQAMAQIGVDRCIYVGDSEVDVQTATNAGVPCLSVTWGFRSEAQLKEAGATCFCDDPKKLPQILENIMQQM